jgi:hypothetical protein
VDAFGELTQPRLISSRYNRNFCGWGLLLSLSLPALNGNAGRKRTFLAQHF